MDGVHVQLGDVIALHQVSQMSSFEGGTFGSLVSILREVRVEGEEERGRVRGVAGVAGKVGREWDNRGDYIAKNTQY